ncbi:uncharacterized protein FIBRA_07156 [Fibroporia radiculosa]|uniref:Uncharacterized protein n=1 Tax=Fibroporia radiculosa TaxID=599839 RepID=J4H4G6_9APHY|nr:uncharacterized protein FIBRA_07156 [Fibroporia radiculosa]CCM04959.1 predicted protein [Fibroporia radiculosa]
MSQPLKSYRMWHGPESNAGGRSEEGDVREPFRNSCFKFAHNLFVHDIAVFWEALVVAAFDVRKLA